MKTITILLVLFSFSFLSADLVAERDDFSSMPGWDIESNQEPATDSRPENLRVTNTWNGSSGVYWHTPANWNLNHAPLDTEDALIPAISSNRYPEMSGYGGCNSLTVDHGALLDIRSGTLIVISNANFYGALIMNGGTNLNVNLDLIFFSTASANFTISATISVKRNVEFRSGSSVNMPRTKLSVIGTSHSNIRTYAPTVLGELYTSKPVSGSTSISNLSTADLSIKSLEIASSTTMHHHYVGTTIVRRGIIFAASSTANFADGTLKMETGDLNSTITDNNSAGNSLNNLIISKTNGRAIIMGSNLNVKGNLTIQSGSLIAQSYWLKVGGNWTNNVGTDGFVPGTSTVQFTQVGGIQSISGTNRFYNVLDNHTGNSLAFVGYTEVSFYLAVTASVSFDAGGSFGNVSNTQTGATLFFYSYYNYTINSYNGGGAIYAFTGSHVIINDLSQDGLYGSFTADGSTLEIHQDALQDMDLNGNMFIHNYGVVDIYGGRYDCNIAKSANTTFIMSSGSFNLKDKGIYIRDRGHACNFIISGGTISVNGNWKDDWGIFDPTGGSVEMTGYGNTSIHPHDSSWFWNLRVNKVAMRESDEQQFSYDRDASLTAISSNEAELRFDDAWLHISAIILKGGMDIQAVGVVRLYGDINSTNNGEINIENGTFLLYGSSLISTGNINVNANGSLVVAQPGSLLINGGRSINVNNGGTLLVNGDSDFSARISHNGAGYYDLNVNSGGTIGAEYGIFEYVNASGITLNPGSLVDTNKPFKFCTFRLGDSGGRLLTINNSQSFTINGAAFPSNNGGFNVSKTVNSGSVFFSNWSGAFGGPSYEQDSHNRINWQGTDNPSITDLSISYISSVNRVRLDWTYPLTVTNFKIYRSLDPEGTFAHHSTVTTNTWSEVVPGPKYFYKVTAVTP